jgi:hypothetical protein
MDILTKIHKEQFGFITEDQIDELIEKNRLMKVLVRCGCGRFVCPVQDVRHFISIIQKEGSDYIRDISIPVLS